jgi:hypothetical protein
MKRVTGLEAALQKVAGLGFGRGSVHCRPFGWELRTPPEAPIAEGLSNIPSYFFTSKILKKTPPYDLANLCLIVSDQVFRDASHNFGDSLLPL